jgi:centromere protein C
MGVPTAGGPDYIDNSPTFTVLSKVSTAAPSTRGSSDGGSKKSSSIVAKSRHAMREEQDRVQLERLANRGNASPPLNEDDEDYGNDEDDFGPVDPPEEQSRIQAKGSGGAAGRGVDPDEREDVLEPEPDALEKSLVEVSNLHGNNDYDDDDDFGGGGNYDAEEEDVHFGTQVGDGDDDAVGGDFHGGNDDDEEDEERRAPSSKKHTSKKEDTKKTKKKQSKKKDERESSVDTTPTSVLRTSKKSKKKKQTTSNRVNWSTPTGISRGIPAGNRDYEAVPVSVYREDRDEDSASLRRSNRARFAPLAFWKNEKLIYEAQHEEGILGEAMGDMPVVVAVQKAQPTPYKEVKRTVPEKKKTKSKNKEGKRKRGGDSDSEDDDDTNVSSTKKKFDDATLRKKYRIHNGESGKVWSETLESVTETKIVSRIDNRTFSKLPLSASRKKRESKVVGFASQSFHVPTDDDDLFPGYISGNVVLPPRGIKDAEGVGLCSQVFNVGDCQPNSLEFALADPSGQDGEFDPKTAQRFLLSKGDMFQIPPGNVYRIENHSANVKATLFWTIIKCTSRAEQDEEDSEEDR